MKRLKFFLHDLHELLTQNVTVREIAEPLASFDAEQNAASIQQFKFKIEDWALTAMTSESGTHDEAHGAGRWAAAGLCALLVGCGSAPAEAQRSRGGDMRLRDAALGDKVADILQAEGVTVEEMLEGLDEERERYYREHYVNG